VPPPVPEDLLEQADRLTIEGASETNFRRAISNAYYALFDLALTAAADMVVGDDQRASPRYSLVYRSVDHKHLRTLCRKVSATVPQNVALTPVGGFGILADFARITLNLSERREEADYDPSKHFTLTDATLEIANARQAIEWFRQSSEQHEAFLTMLLFKGRS
jgi:hypothetical protein